MRLRVTALLAAAAVVGLAVPAVAGAGLPAGHDRSPLADCAVAPAPLKLGMCFHTTNFRGTTIGVSTAGNIIQFTSPDSAGAQYEHIAVGDRSEGYVLCYDPTPAPGSTPKAYDTGEDSDGFKPPGDSGSTVTRFTSDGKLKLTQIFTFSEVPGATTLLIQMNVTNLSSAPLTHVVLRRQVDFDIDTGGLSGWAGFRSSHARTKAAVMAFHDPSEPPPGKEAHGIMLRTVVTGAHGAATSMVTKSRLDHTCTPASATKVPPPASDPKFTIYRGDFGDSMSYPFDTLAPHATGSVTVGYLRY